MRSYRDTNASLQGRSPGSAVRFAVREVVENLNRQVASRATRAVNAIRNAELEVLTGERSGKRYTVPDTGRTDRKTGKRIRGSGVKYTASAPGEPPARRTGNLRLRWSGSVETSANSNGTEVIATLESEMPYAGYLENGVPSRNLKPRPFVDRIIEKAAPEIERIYEEPYT